MANATWERARNELTTHLLVKNQEEKRVKFAGREYDPAFLLDQLDRNSKLSRQLVMGRYMTLARQQRDARRKRWVLAGVVLCLTLSAFAWWW